MGGVPENSYPVHQAPVELWPAQASRNNATGTDAELLDRWKIREICEGWGLYRDAAEWKNYRSMFHDDAYIVVSWVHCPIDDFIKASIAGFEQGSSWMYIGHRIIGQTVDVHGNRAVSKMKVTITCRFTFDGIECDNEADCRFFFLLEKRGGKWAICLMTLLFDKDKMVPVHPGKCFEIPIDEVMKYPSGYRYLCWCEEKIGRPPNTNLNSHGPERDMLYTKCKDWLDGKKVEYNIPK